MKRVICNKYIVHFTDGNILEVYASTKSGANAQVKAMAKYIVNIERVYKSGAMSVAPF